MASDEKRAANELERDDVPSDRGAPPDSVERVEREAWTSQNQRDLHIRGDAEEAADDHPTVVEPRPSDD